jgi:formate-dependent nitrite reductase cytochrome c552 subunit
MKKNRPARRQPAASFLSWGATLLLTLALAPGGESIAAPANAAIEHTGGTTPADLGVRRPTPHYVGTVYCYACHQELSLEFARTAMGKLFLVKPQNDLERKGCEGCHGPASNHAESGGGLGVGGMAEFRIDRGQSIERNNRACLQCHDEAFWHGGTHGLRRMACFDCHVVMVRTSPTFQLAPAAAGASWNRGRTWGDAAIVGLLAGAVFGGWRRLRLRRRRKG